VADIYVPNPRHKHPWQSGTRGTLCPRDADGPALFDHASVDPRNPGKRYGTDGARAYCAYCNNTVDPDGNVAWHGFPISWTDVPTAVQKEWIAPGRIKRLRLRD